MIEFVLVKVSLKNNNNKANKDTQNPLTNE